MSWMHTWTGLLFGWVLYFMFLTGSAGYYDTEIDRWMQPENPAPVEVVDPAALFQAGLDYASAQSPGADEYYILLPTSRSYSPYIYTSWKTKDEEGKTTRGSVSLLADGSVVEGARDTNGGQALYRMHWTFHYIPRSVGELIAGLAAFFMLAAIISGIITHKKILVDFFTLRTAKGQRSWLDSHNIVSVVTLPYQIMITFSGLLFVASSFFIPIFLVQYGISSDTQATIYEELYGIKDPVERSG
ncbi:MAG: PepSY-associated TM helix domain-containing protein, partial [Pseudomonadota bacterium]